MTKPEDTRVEKWFFYENGMRKGPISSRSLASVIRYGALNKDSLLLRLGVMQQGSHDETGESDRLHAGGAHSTRGHVAVTLPHTHPHPHTPRCRNVH